MRLIQADFLDFLYSGEKDIHAFAKRRPGRRRQASKPDGLPTVTLQSLTLAVSRGRYAIEPLTQTNPTGFKPTF